MKIFRDKLFIACLIVIFIESIWLLKNSTNGSKQIVLRNALVAEMGTKDNFNWTPDNTPREFFEDRKNIPPKFTEIVTSIGAIGQEGFTATNLIAKHLLQLRGDGHSVRKDTYSTYKRITGDGGGYCADFSQVFTALALAAGVPVREWGFARGDFGGGHAFNEIYSNTYQKWIFVDLFGGFYLLDSHSGVPVSVDEFYKALKSNDINAVRFVRFNPQIFRFRDDQQAWEFYQSGISQYFIWWTNNIFSYESNTFVAASSEISRSLEMLTAIALGIHPKLKAMPDPLNAVAWQNLMVLRFQLLVITVTFPVALLVLCRRIYLKLMTPASSRPL